MNNENRLIDIVAELKDSRVRLLSEISKSIVGQHTVIDQVLISLFANGHLLIEGVPGLAKTLLISTIAKALNLSFNRIQFTPDLMPSDITGTEVLVTSAGGDSKQFQYIKGPIFANIVLADEINRTPPKTQSALLQAMQEYQVTSGNNTWNLNLPFIVMATQNPIEQEGTYPLPEAQLDRFMFYINIDYPSFAEEKQIVELTTTNAHAKVSATLSAEKIIELQQAIRALPVSEHVLEYAVTLVRKTRPNLPESPSETNKWVNWGAGPRASQYLILSAKARAALDGRLTPSEEDVRAVAVSVLQHRVLVSFTAEAEGIKSVDVINKLLNSK